MAATVKTDYFLSMQEETIMATDSNTTSRQSTHSSVNNRTTTPRSVNNSTERDKERKTAKGLTVFHVLIN